MAQSYVQVPVDGAGKRIDAWVTAVATQYRQAIVIGDPDTDANIVAISSRLRLPVELEQLFDFDSGAGSATGSGIGIMIPASGGPVIAGIATQPFFVRLSDGSAAIATLPVSIAGTVTVTGGLTDTQLRATPVPVSAASLPLPTGAATLAEQQTQTASLSVMDDWDETDRAKVNLIAAQAGITGGAGAVAANTPRTTLASDDPAVAVLGATTGAAVITDANGTIQQYLRGLVKLAITAGSWLVSVTGTIADDATTPGNPVMTGGSAKNFDGTDPGAVSAEDDVTRLITDRNRRLYVSTVHPQFWSYHLDTSTAQTDTQIQAAPGSNLAVFIQSIIFSTGAATACNIFFEEGSTKILGPYYLEAIAGRGMNLVFDPPKQVTVNTAVTFTTSASIAQTLDITGFIARAT